ncbi:hypothetical protein BpHYR1_033972 [Brachionus plicatilis]|uniref:Uncharacterized protein n=1 Tax=Brachionus plicatilis TaxID=10195 RepID=A0A3M7PK99_BRAPC|nr:hypothetical protein BpHYR1_033972 [Brachionus plicatilis]
MLAANAEFAQKMAKQSFDQNVNLFKSNIGSGNIYLDGKKYEYKNGIMVDQAPNKALTKNESDQVSDYFDKHVSTKSISTNKLYKYSIIFSLLKSITNADAYSSSLKAVPQFQAKSWSFTTRYFGSFFATDQPHTSASGKTSSIE